jgi:hypothetical protein
LVAEHGERAGVVEYLQVLKLAADEGPPKVEAALQAQLAQKEKWRASQVRERLTPATRKVIELSTLTPSLTAYDALLEGEVAHAG